MKGICLTFYMHEQQKHHKMVMYEWLLEFAKKSNLSGGSVFRGIAGYGRKGIFHEEHFYELSPNVPVEVQFILAKEEAARFLELLKKETPGLFYTQSAVEYGRV